MQFKAKKKKKNDECRCECNEIDDSSSCKNNYMWNLGTCDCKCNKTCKTDEYLDIKKCLCKKRLFSKLVLACEDEILNTRETSLASEGSNCLNRKISLVIIFLLFIVVTSISCYYYYKRYWIKKEYA